MLVALLGCAGASFFFALAESALFALGKWQVRQLADAFPTRGGAVARLLNQPAELLATILMANTLANAMIVALVLVEMMTRGWNPALTGVVLLLVLLLGCETLPKTLAVRSPERWALRVGWVLEGLKTVSLPLQRLGRAINTILLESVLLKSIRTPPAQADEEYRELLEIACQQGAMAQGEKEIILEIIALDKKTAQDAMTPRSRVHCISDELTVPEMLEAARLHRHRRLPMYDETPDTIVGVLDTKLLLLDPAMDLADAIEFPAFVPGSLDLSTLLKALQRQKRGLAVVLDEYGTFAGVITMEDILEEIVGEIRSEGEQGGFVSEKLGPGRWRVNGAMRVSDFQREHPALAEVHGVDTLGGMLTAKLEVVPAAGEWALIQGLKFTALAVDDRRVRELLVEVVRKPGGPS